MRAIKYLVGVSFFAMTWHANAFVGAIYGRVDVKTEHEIIAGLDGPTRTLIQNLAPDVRKEFVEAVRQSLGLIDQGVAKVLADMDSRIAERINHAVCAGPAAIQAGVEEISGVLWGERPKPVSYLMETYERRAEKFPALTAEAVAIRYEDLLQQAAIAGCRLADSAGKHRVEKLRTDVRERWRTWQEIEEVCDTPENCIEHRRKSIAELLKSSDARDVEKAEAYSQFDRVQEVRPERSAFANLMWHVGLRQWSKRDSEWLLYEPALIELRNIERGVAIAKGNRQLLAKQRIEATAQTLATAETAIKNAQDSLIASASSTPEAKAALQSNQENKAAASKALPDRAVVVETINLAVEGDSSFAEQAKTLVSRLDALPDAARSVELKADTYNTTIESAEKTRQEEAKETARRMAEYRQRQQDKFSPK